jgi:hypothetical protein
VIFADRPRALGPPLFGPQEGSSIAPDLSFTMGVVATLIAMTDADVDGRAENLYQLGFPQRRPAISRFPFI